MLTEGTGEARSIGRFISENLPEEKSSVYMTHCSKTFVRTTLSDFNQTKALYQSVLMITFVPDPPFKY